MSTEGMKAEQDQQLIDSVTKQTMVKSNQSEKSKNLHNLKMITKLGQSSSTTMWSFLFRHNSCKLDGKV